MRVESTSLRRVLECSNARILRGWSAPDEPQVLCQIGPVVAPSAQRKGECIEKPSWCRRVYDGPSKVSLGW